MKNKKYLYSDILLLGFFASLFCSLSIFRNFWWDEALTLTDFIQLPYIEIYKQYTIANNHIVYTLLLKTWDLLLGNLLLTSELHYRSFSILIAILSLLLGYFFLSKLFSKRTALILSSAFGTSPAFAIYGTAVRGYMLSVCLIFLIYFSVYNIFKKKSKIHCILLFPLAFFTVGIMPTNLIGIYFVIISLSPFFITSQNNKITLKKLNAFIAQKHILALLIIPLLAFCAFYLPLANKLFNILKNNSGFNSHISSLLNLYLGLTIAFFPCVILILFFHHTYKSKKNERHDAKLKYIKKISGFSKFENLSLFNINITFLALAFFFPVMLIFSRTPSPFPRIFFQLWPVFMFIIAFYIELALVKTHAPSRTVKQPNINHFSYYILKYYTLIIIIWAGIMINITPLVSQKFFLSGMNDDFVSPYYMKNFFPAQLVQDANKLYQQTNTQIFVSQQTDYPSINLYSALFNTRKAFRYLYLPNRPAIKNIPKNIDFFYIAGKPENINNFIKTYGIKQKLQWTKKYGIQNLYFFKKLP